MAQALLIAGTAYSAYSSIKAGREQSAAYQAQGVAAYQQSQYNAGIYEQQAEMVKAKKKIHDYQFNRQMGRADSAIIAQTAGKGLLFSGSPLAVLADNKSQMLFDKAIDDYNLDIEKYYALSGAQYQRMAGTSALNQANEAARVSRSAGYTNAFSTILSAGSSYALRRV